MTHTHTHTHEHLHADGHQHGGAADHSHTDDHAHGLEGYHVHGGSPVLDIGGDVGAMLVTMPRTAVGTELHLRSERDPSRDVHTGVWERDHASNSVPTALFPELLEGGYDVLDSVGASIMHVQIEGGRLTTIDLTD